MDVNYAARPFADYGDEDRQSSEAADALEVIGVAVQCKGCGKWIDPAWCWCGSDEKSHGWGENHGFVPMGCGCHRDRAVRR